MTNEQAIKILKARSKFVAEINLDAQIAYRMAMQALEKTKCSREIAYNPRRSNSQKFNSMGNR